jgi:excisionase family DNA binding protein
MSERIAYSMRDAAATRIAYSIAEAAEALGVHRHTVERMIRAGYLPVWQCGRIRRIPRADLEALIRHDVPSVWPAAQRKAEGVAP